MTSDIADIKRRFADTCAVENNKDRIVEVCQHRPDQRCTVLAILTHGTIVQDLFSYIEALHADVQSKGDEADNHQRVIRSLREENTRNKNVLDDIRRDQVTLAGPLAGQSLTAHRPS